MAKNNTDNNKENKKSLIKKVLAAFVIIDIIVGVVFLICYFNGCNPFKKNTSSSTSSVVDTTDYQLVDTNLKKIVEHQMELDGFDNKPVEQVVAVSYYDYAPTSFDIIISATSAGYLYNLNIKGVQYKEGTDTVVSYLLCNNELEGEINLYREQIKGYEYITQAGIYVTSVPISGTDEHKTGYELIDNNFHVRQLTDHWNNSSGELSAYQTIVIEEGQPLYNYFRYLLNR